MKKKRKKERKKKTKKKRTIREWQACWVKLVEDKIEFLVTLPALMC